MAGDVIRLANRDTQSATESDPEEKRCPRCGIIPEGGPCVDPEECGFKQKAQNWGGWH